MTVQLSPGEGSVTSSVRDIVLVNTDAPTGRTEIPRPKVRDVLRNRETWDNDNFGKGGDD
jgi:hypothetical protein